jgi:hypothetical protein
MSRVRALFQEGEEMSRAGRAASAAAGTRSFPHTLHSYAASHCAVLCAAATSSCLATCRAEVERHRGETAAAANDERSVALRALSNELASIEEAAEEYEGKHGQAVQMVDSLRAAVLDMFNRAGWVRVWAGAGAQVRACGSRAGCFAAQQAAQTLHGIFVLSPPSPSLPSHTLSPHFPHHFCLPACLPASSSPSAPSVRWAGAQRRRCWSCWAGRE